MCGNDREFCFDLTRLADASPEERMVFETSNRHLADGFRRVVEVGVVTGISRNHEPDHGSFEAYRQAKYRMADQCKELLYHESIPRAYDDAGPLVERGTPYGPTAVWTLDGTDVTGPGGRAATLPGAGRLSAPNRQNAAGCGGRRPVHRGRPGRRGPALVRARRDICPTTARH